jgi:hypothetical protein
VAGVGRQACGHRAWGLQQRHAAKLAHLRRAAAALEAANSSAPRPRSSSVPAGRRSSARSQSPSRGTVEGSPDLTQLPRAAREPSRRGQREHVATAQGGQNKAAPGLAAISPLVRAASRPRRERSALNQVSGSRPDAPARLGVGQSLRSAGPAVFGETLDQPSVAGSRTVETVPKASARFTTSVASLSLKPAAKPVIAAKPNAVVGFRWW